MTEIIVVPNGMWRIFSWKLLQSTDVSQLPEEVKIGNFEEDSLADDELVKIVEAYLQLQSSGSDLIIEPLDFLPFKFFDQGKTAGQAVCCLLRQFAVQELDKIIELAKQDARIRGEAIKWFVDNQSPIDPAKDEDKEKFKQQASQKWVPCGTGFLVGKNYLLTNLHVVEKQEHLFKFQAAFAYEGDINRTQRYSFDTSFWKPADNQSLDYVLLKLKPENGKEAGEDFDPINLASVDSVKIFPRLIVQKLYSLFQEGKLPEQSWDQLQERGINGDVVNIIQHPEGRAKEIVIFNNQLDQLYENFLVYTSDTLPGSSGSPLFNVKWELIGIHQAALLNPNGKVRGYLGIRMDKILADLKKQENKPDSVIKAFLNEVLQRQPANPPPDSATNPPKQKVFILAGRDRSRILGDELAKIEQNAMQKLQQAVKKALNELDPNIEVILVDGSNKDIPGSIQHINQAAKSLTNQSVAIELLMDSYPKDAKVGGISVYYNGSNSQAKNYATTFLGAIDEKLKRFSVGVYSDLATSQSRLAFCRRIIIPSLVFYAGYLSNTKDLALIQALQPDQPHPLAQGIASGLFAWLNFLVSLKKIAP